MNPKCVGAAAETDEVTESPPKKREKQHRLLYATQVEIDRLALPLFYPDRPDIIASISIGSRHFNF
jgi:hypothetical protein